MTTKKNVTVSITEELAKELEGLPEVNWSEVCRQAIKKYIESRRQYRQSCRLCRPASAGFKQACQAPIMAHLFLHSGRLGVDCA